MLLKLSLPNLSLHLHMIDCLIEFIRIKTCQKYINNQKRQVLSASPILFQSGQKGEKLMGVKQCRTFKTYHKTLACFLIELN